MLELKQAFPDWDEKLEAQGVRLQGWGGSSSSSNSGGSGVTPGGGRAAELGSDPSAADVASDPCQWSFVLACNAEGRVSHL